MPAIPGNPSRFSSARSFAPPVGSNLLPLDRVGGYYIDFAEKAFEPRWPPPWLKPRAEQLHVATAQWGLGAYERYLVGEGEQWLAAAREAAAHLLELQTDGGPLDGGFPHLHAMPHTYSILPPWLSAMAQGDCASLLVRVALADGDERYAEAARRALAPLRVAVADGGVRTELRGRPFVEEYPTNPSSCVLNGAIFALWGLRDIGLGLDDARASAEYEELTDALAASLHLYDLGWWSRYDLYPHRIPNVASGAYHLLHITQLKAMQIVSPRPEFGAAVERWERYAASRLKAARAFAGKATFRLLVPRNRMVAPR